MTENIDNVDNFRELLPNYFSEFLSSNTHTFSELLPKKTKHILRVLSNITDTFRGLLSNNTTHVSRHQTILTFSESYWQTILDTFPEFISSNTDNFREFLPILAVVKTFFRAHITQYWHFQVVTTKQYWLI